MLLPCTPLGELESIKLLPGMVDPSADTLHKAWRAGIDLAACAGDHPRLDSIARLVTAVLAQLPARMMRPTDLVASASLSLDPAITVPGSVQNSQNPRISPSTPPLMLNPTTPPPATTT